MVSQPLMVSEAMPCACSTMFDPSSRHQARASSFTAGRWARSSRSTSQHTVLSQASSCRRPPASADAMDDASRKADVPTIARWAVGLKSDDAVRSIFQGAVEARMVTAPMLVITGSLDTTVPPAQAQQVLDASASVSKQFVMVEGAGHNNLPFRSAPASAAITSFLHR